MLENVSSERPQRRSPRLKEAFVHPNLVLAISLITVPALAVFAGKSTVPTLIAATVLAVPSALFQGWRPSRPSLSSLALGAATSGWAAAASLWSFDPAEALSTELRIVCLVVLAWVLGDIAARTPTRRGPGRRCLARCAIAGLAIASAVLLVEMTFEMPIKTAVTGLWGEAQADGSETNRGGTFILVALWLVLPLTAAATSRAASLALALAVLTGAALAVAESGTNQLAVLGGAAFFGLALLGARVRLTLWACVIFIAVIAVPWLSQASFDAGIHNFDGLWTSAQHRLFIWNYASEWALEKPLTGWGYDSSSEFSNRGIEPWPEYSSVIPLHPHNATLQIWLEMGAVGAVLAVAVVVRIAQCTEDAGAIWAPWLGAATVSALIAANLGYGIWQTQWVAALAWLTCYARLAVSIPLEGWPLHTRNRSTRALAKRA
jgi:O-antigen ligase